MLAVRLALAMLAQMLLLGALLFAPAGTLRWERAWALLAAHLLAGAIAIVALLPRHRAVLEERLRAPVREGQPPADVLVSATLVATLLASIAAAPLDLFRLHLMPEARWPVPAAGAVLGTIGFVGMALAMRDNPFAATVVRHQRERGHAVARAGVYAIVRHPMYAGACLWMPGVALWLGSYAAALFTLAPMATLVVRIRLEERFLRRELPGYEAYAREVRWRLVPRVW